MRRNPAIVALGIATAASLILGALLWIVGANQLRDDRLGSDYFTALNLDNGTNFVDPNSGALSADNALIWWGIALVIFGGLLFIATLVTMAITRQLRIQAEPAPKTYSEYKDERPA